MGIFRERMIKDLQLAGYALGTQGHYVRSARNLVAFHMRPPTELNAEDVREFFVDLHDKGASLGVLKMHVAGIKWLYVRTLNLPEIVQGLRYPRVASMLPEILSGTEVEALLGALKVQKYRMLVTTMYATGLRLSEVCRLETGDLDAARMLVRVRAGKGRKDRVTMLSPRLLEELREYWVATQPRRPYLFPAKSPRYRTVSPKTVRAALRQAAERAGLRKKVTPHVLRHCFGSHMLHMGAELRQIQLLLGHSSIETTARYTQMTPQYIAAMRSPFDVLGTKEAERLG